MNGPDVFVVGLAACAGLPDARVGGKARGLGRLIAGGFAVTDGVCVTAGALDLMCATDAVGPAFARFTDAVRDQPAHRSAAAAALRSALALAPFPAVLAGQIREAVAPLLVRGPVAVRSSAIGEDGDASAQAGVYVSVLGVSDSEAVLEAIRKCWMSLYTSAAMAATHGAAHPGMAVVVQEMADADHIGVLFTVDPVNPVPGTLVLEWADRSPDAVTSGRAATRVHLGASENPPGLPLPADVFRLTARRLEELFTGPVDAEWAAGGGGLTLLQARPVTALRPAEPGWAEQEDLPGMNRLWLGRCRSAFARSLQKKVWFRNACRQAGFDVYGVAYLNYDPADPRPVTDAVLDRFGAEVLQVDLGDGPHAVRRGDLAGYLSRHAARNPVGGTLSAAQVGEVVLADTTGFSTLLGDGSVWVEVFPAGVSGIKSGSRRPTVYRLDPRGGVRERKLATTTVVGRYDPDRLRWRVEAVTERPVDVSEILRQRILGYTVALSAALGEARLEWYAVNDHLYAKDVSLETEALPTSGEAITLSAGAAEGPVLRIDNLAELDAYAEQAGISVFAHGDEDNRVTDPLRARLTAAGPAPIVVAEYPSIGLIPSIGRTAGFVFSRGTLLSHTAIALRERRIPAVIDEASASALRDGDLVTISPDGKVRRSARSGGPA